MESEIGRLLGPRIATKAPGPAKNTDLCFAKVKICKSVDIIHIYICRNGPYRRHNLSDHPGQLTNGFRELTVKVVFTIIKEKIKVFCIINTYSA